MVILPGCQELVDELAQGVRLVGDGRLAEQDKMTAFARFAVTRSRGSSAWLRLPWSYLGSSVRSSVLQNGGYQIQAAESWIMGLTMSRSWRDGIR